MMRHQTLLALSIAVVVVLCKVVSDSTGVGTSENIGWGSLAFLSTASGPQFHEFIAPLANMTTLTYTSTLGSTYWNPKQANASVSGWWRSWLSHDPPKGGMRALVFLQNRTKRGVVAFRGTDLNITSPSGQADACANKLLWEGADAPLPSFCHHFSAQTIDYFGRAQQFVARVHLTYPDIQFAFTGHSLGAGLGALIAASPHHTLPAVVFSAPGILQVLKNRTTTNPSTVAKDELFVLADKWDPVYRSAVQGGGLVGTVCTWGTREEPDCVTCYAAPAVNLSSLACANCFIQHHIYGHYLSLIADQTMRPKCIK